VLLDPVQARIIGCLIEKERATPQGYPLTLNALRLACNQSTNRDPVTAYGDAELENSLADLRQRGLTRIVYSTSNRSAKYRHVLGDVLHLGADELAVLAVLLLRGPQTVGELKGRTERLHPFGDLGDVQQTLDRLAARDEPLVVRLERQPGQKDARWVHLLGGEPTAGTADPRTVSAPSRFDEGGARAGGEDDDGYAAAPASSAPATPLDGTGTGARAGGPSVMTAAEPSRYDDLPRALTDEITGLRAEVASLRAEVSVLRAEFDAFRAEFG
jgi:uncharacterized protein YceH (UPF0502 family)